MRRATEAARDRLGSQLRGLIIDVRGNPGGLLDQAVKLSDLFLKSGAILRTRGRHPRSLQFFDADPEVIGSDIPIAVLLDGASASAAEIVASAPGPGPRDRDRRQQFWQRHGSASVALA